MDFLVLKLAGPDNDDPRQADVVGVAYDLKAGQENKALDALGVDAGRYRVLRYDNAADLVATRSVDVSKYEPPAEPEAPAEG